MMEKRGIGRWPKLPCRVFFPRILPMAISVKWKMVLQIPPERWQAGEKNNISKKKHYPTVNAEDITVGAYCLLWINSFKFYTSLFSQIFFLVYPFTLFFIWNGWPICCFKGNFIINYNCIPYLCFYVFYFIFHINYLVFLLESLVFIELRLSWDLKPR